MDHIIINHLKVHNINSMYNYFNINNISYLGSISLKFLVKS